MKRQSYWMVMPLLAASGLLGLGACEAENGETSTPLEPIACADLPEWSETDTYLEGSCEEVGDGCTVEGYCSRATWTCREDHVWFRVTQEEDMCCGGNC